MDTEGLLEIGERGIHLLFDTGTINEAFRQDADRLRDDLADRFQEVHFAIEALTKLTDADEGRRFIDGLNTSIRYVLVLLYFELLDGRLRRKRILH